VRHERPATRAAGSPGTDGAGQSHDVASDERLRAPARRRPELGERIELQIDSLAHGGEGVARLGEEGYVVFVSGAIPGDRVLAEVVKRKRSYAHARAVQVLHASPERIPPTADHPGVAWQVMPYERQLEIKQQQVDDALRRIGRLDGFELEPIVPAVAQWRYRNKLEYSFGERDGQLVCGFHAPGGYKRVEPIDDCLLASELGNRAREVALQWCRAQSLGAWDRRRESIAAAVPLLRNLVVREGRATGVLQVRLVTTPGHSGGALGEQPRRPGEPEIPSGGSALLPGDPGCSDRMVSLAHALARELGGERLSGVLWTRSDALAETTAGGETELVWGQAELPECLGDLDLLISPEAFFQTNTEMASVLYGVVGEYARLRGWERVFDLYCGIGTIALTLAPRAGEVWGIELVEEAVADAIAAAHRNEISKARFFPGDARLELPELVQRAGRPDVAVVDPPRAGLSQKVVRRVIDASPKRVVYVSCNPTTLAPNAAQLVEAGYGLVKVRPVDMFPQTPHIECVALFER
jgi:23S rRNA (uracil1939-C5)-methyltransferase